MKRKSYNLPHHAHFLTFSCYRRMRLLGAHSIRRELLRHWDEARRLGRFRIWAYVLMPEHVHLLIYPEDESYQISQVLRRLKEPFSRWVVQHWEREALHLVLHLTVRRGPRIVRRFWQEGGGYDRNLLNWDTIGRAVRYIENNPVRRGLSADPLGWEWSSARARAGATNVPIALDDFEIVQ